MCGISGFLGKYPIQNAERRIQAMNLSLEHRGPDAQGHIIVHGETVALGHRRLSVIDPDVRADQPMTGAIKGGILVYNGEIYNYKELRRQCDYPFSTNSDTEVLLAGMEIFGAEKWLPLCNGMFAFAYYDSSSGTLLLARDRFGIKPLYWYTDGNVFVFSSEIKGILHSGLAEAEFDAAAVDEYLAYRYVREPYTFFRNIRQLPAGCYMTVGENLKVEVRRYWQLPEEFNDSLKYDEETIFGRFKEELVRAIEKRMVADVPLGTYLSGGVDSGLITALAAQLSGKSPDTYTVGFPEFNEFKQARRVAQRYATRHHEIILDENAYLEKLEEIIQFRDAPLGVPNEIPLAVMSTELKKSITVVLSGEGADELMGGYGKIFRLPFDFENLERERDEDFYSRFISAYEYVPRTLRDRYLGVCPVYRDEFDERLRAEFARHGNEENVFRFFHNYHVKGLLQRVDTTTMCAGVEARVPFLDHELVEFCYREVPYDLKLKWKSAKSRETARSMQAVAYSEELDTPKYLLRKMALEYLPEETVVGKKIGFPVPLDTWFGKLANMARELLRGTDWLRMETPEVLIEDCRKRNRGGQMLWMFLNIELFKRQYFGRTWKY